MSNWAFVWDKISPLLFGRFASNFDRIKQSKYSNEMSFVARGLYTQTLRYRIASLFFSVFSFPSVICFRWGCVKILQIVEVSCWNMSCPFVVNNSCWRGFAYFCFSLLLRLIFFIFFCVFEYKGKTWCLGYWSQNVPTTCAKMQVAFRMLISMWKCLRKAIGARVQLALMILMLKCLRRATYWRKRSTCFYDIDLKMFRKSNWRKS